jgi:hypothetical protein
LFFQLMPCLANLRTCSTADAHADADVPLVELPENPFEPVELPATSEAKGSKGAKK